VGFSPFTPPHAPFKSGAATGVVAARAQRPKPSGRESPLRRCWTNGTQFTRNLQRNFPEADFWGISVTSGDPLLSRILTAQSRIVGLSSDGLVSNSPGLYPLHDETFW
jgi:hypothetical protein